MRPGLTTLTLTALLLSGCFGGEPTILAIAVHPKDPRIVYVSARDSVYKTRDRGRTWEKMDQGLEGANVISLAIDPVLSSTVYAGTFAMAVYKSQDGGQRWRPANIGLKEHVSVVNAIAIHPSDPRTVYLATTVGPYRSTNGGDSWVEIVHGMESVYAVDIKIDPKAPLTLYTGTSGGMYRSRDRGNRWEIINKGLIAGEVDVAMALGVNAIAIDPEETSNLYIGTTKGIFATINAGDFWEPKNQGLTTDFVNRLALDPLDRNTLYAGTNKGIFKSTDRAGTWIQKNAGLTNLIVRSMALDPNSPNTVYVGTQKGLFRSEDGAETWQLIPGIRSGSANRNETG